MPATKTKRRIMKVDQIKRKAKRLGITAGKMKKAELIHSIQMAEGCTPCFGRSDGQCVYTDCCFMPDCLKTRL
ncbi:MAG: SAP domain-containing protein [Planctomycetota bacterium]